MNSNTLDKTKDPGKDGTVYPSGVFAARNERVAKDVVGFSLGYYGGDYSPIGGNPAEAAYAGTAFGNGSADLFNGNIRHMVTAIEGLEIQGYAYRYDQLQRIKQMRVYRANDVQSLFAWTNSGATDEYKTTFSYDRNGNLLSLNRNGIGTELDMDRFVYNYHTLGGQPSNRLNYVVDNGTDYSAYDDIKSGQTSGNYTYNKIGELIEDASEDMELEWRTGDHKLLRVIRTDDASPNLTFIYNPFGQRIMKIAAERANGNPTGQNIFTFYSYDANGQVMAVYEINWQADTYTLKERHLYGAERLGVNSEEVTIYQGGNFTPYTHKEEDVVHTKESGHKRYELTNHLGNVLATINDRKVYNSTDGNYEAVVMSWADYYAGHALMPGRHGNSGTYRYGGANGQEKVDEISGEGNHYTAEYWEYDSRIVRRWNQDPIVKYHESPYACFANNPILFADPNGADSTWSNKDGTWMWTTEQGDTYEGISGRTGVPVEDLRYYNQDILKDTEIPTGVLININDPYCRKETSSISWSNSHGTFHLPIFEITQGESGARVPCGIMFCPNDDTKSYFWYQVVSTNDPLEGQDKKNPDFDRSLSSKRVRSNDRRAGMRRSEEMEEMSLQGLTSVLLPRNGMKWLPGDMLGHYDKPSRWCVNAKDIMWSAVLALYSYDINNKPERLCYFQWGFVMEDGIISNIVFRTNPNFGSNSSDREGKKDLKFLNDKIKSGDDVPVKF